MLKFAVRDIARGDSLSGEDIEIRRAEVGGSGEYFTSTEWLTGVRVKNAIRAGTVLRASNVKPPAIVRRGDRVTMKVAVGSVEISSTGTARQDGGRGERIRVYNETTHATMLCRILDSSTVTVENEGG